jgi:beta-galactosidase beta subunit
MGLTPQTLHFEAHGKNIDVHYVVMAVEAIGWTPTELLRSPTTYDESRDAWFSTVPPYEITPIRFFAG